MTIVNELIAGDTLDFTTSLDGYPASAGWQLKYALRGTAGAIDLTASASGDDYHVQASASTTSAWAPGVYRYVATVTLSGQRYTVAEGSLTVLPDLAQQVAGYDGRSLAEKALADAEAALANFRASGGRIKSYTIGARTMAFEDSAAILAVINFWKAKVLAEQTPNLLAAGLGNPRKLHVRFK